MVIDGWPAAGARFMLLVVEMVGLRVDDSVTGHGRLRLLLSDEVSSATSSLAGSALAIRKRERKANIGQATRRLYFGGFFFSSFGCVMLEV